MWTLPEPPSPLPLYRRIVLLVEELIDAGRLEPGQKLPPERELAAVLHVNRSTVVRALDDLAERGIILRRQGSGSFVNPEKWGVQSYPLVNWRENPTSRMAPGSPSASMLSGQLPQHGLDLSGDGLPAALLPDLPDPRGFGLDWKDLLRAEQDEDPARPGLLLFRRSVAAYLARAYGLAVDEEDLLITSGTRQAAFLLTQTLLRPGDAVGVEAPSYYYSLPLFQAAGLRLLALPTDSQGVIPEELERLARRQSIRMLFLNPVFHNPTGAVMSRSRKRQVVELCREYRLPLMEDDAYGSLAFDDLVDPSPLKCLDQADGVLLAGSLSSYTGSGLRAGWLVAPRAMVNRLARVRSLMDSGLSVLPQLLGAAYLDRVHDTHAAMLRHALQQGREKLLHMLEPLAGRFHCDLPRGGTFLYLRLDDSSRSSCLTFERHLLELGLLPAAGTDFGDTAGGYRFNFAWLGTPNTGSSSAT